MQDIPKCYNCQQDYNLTQAIPIMLPCKHTYCKVCLRTIYAFKNYFSCQICRNIFYLKFEDLTTDDRLMREIQEKEKNKQQILEIQQKQNSLKRQVMQKTNEVTLRQQRISSSFIYKVRLNYLKIQQLILQTISQKQQNIIYLQGYQLRNLASKLSYQHVYEMLDLDYTDNILEQADKSIIK